MGLATGQEAKLVVDMVARYPEVKAELKAIEESMEAFDQRNAVEPPAHLKSKILGKISDSGLRIPDSAKTTASGISKETTKMRSLNEAPKQNNFYKYAAAVGLILLVASAWYIISLRGELERQREDIAGLTGLRDMYQRQAQQSDSMLGTMVDFEKTLLAEIRLLKEPGMKVIELKGMEIAPDAKAMAYANTANGEVYLEIMNLPPAPEGMQYQFWGIVDGKPVDAGMIPLAQNELAGIHPMKTIPNSQAYAISLEPKGGSQQPQGKIYVMGNS